MKTEERLIVRRGWSYPPSTLIRVSADAKLTHPSEVKLTHLG